MPGKRKKDSAGRSSKKTLSRFNVPTALPVAAAARDRAAILINLTRCFYVLLEPDRPPVTEGTGLSELFRPAWLGQALATAIWEWYGKKPWLQSGLLAQALS